MRRVEACIESHGGHFEYFVSGHMLVWIFIPVSIFGTSISYILYTHVNVSIYALMRHLLYIRAFVLEIRIIFLRILRNILSLCLYLDFYCNHAYFCVRIVSISTKKLLASLSYF
jgi:hypothetical protein